jgi:hypothetical protein
VLFAQVLANAASAGVAGALMHPSLKGASGLPLWPFFGLACLAGPLPLLAYIICWQAPQPAMRLPPSPAQMVGGGTARPAQPALEHAAASCAI